MAPLGPDDVINDLDQKIDELKSLLNRSIVYVSAAADDNQQASVLFHDIRQEVPYE